MQLIKVVRANLSLKTKFEGNRRRSTAEGSPVTATAMEPSGFLNGQRAPFTHKKQEMKSRKNISISFQKEDAALHA